MAANWARPAFAGVDDIFETLHSGLTVKLVSTPRHELKICKWSELASESLTRIRTTSISFRCWPTPVTSLGLSAYFMQRIFEREALRMDRCRPFAYL